MNVTAETCNVTDELSVRAHALTGSGIGREASRKEGRMELAYALSLLA